MEAKMRKIQLEQGSDAWLTWRRNLLTATDAAMLLGKSPYTTPFKGWQRKIGDAPEQEVNANMLRGQADEPRAREMFIAEYGINMTPCCVASDKYNFLGASLDGISDCGRFIQEIKSQNIESIRNLGIPEFHMFQMQHQLLCGDGQFEKCFYTTIWGNEIYTIEVLPNEEWAKDYIPKAKEFWRMCVFKEAPALTCKDYKKMDGVGKWDSLAFDYRRLSEEIKTLEELKDSYKKELIKLCGDDNCAGKGIKVLKKITKGRIDYAEAVEVLNIHDDLLKQFEKPPTMSWTIMIDKKAI